MKALAIAIIIVSMMIPVVSAEDVVPITYRAEIDQDYGFYRVIDITTYKPALYKNNTLTINIGDTVIWENDATPDEPLTIISKDNLWSNKSAYLRWNYQKFNYTFNESGTYEVYIKEYPREQHQIIIVSPTETQITVVPTTNVAPIKTVSPTETMPTGTVSTTGTMANKDTNNLSLTWLLIIIIGVIIFIIYGNRKNKK